MKRHSSFQYCEILFMHWKVHYKNMSRIRNGSHMSNATRVIRVQSRFPTLIQSWTKLLGRLALLKYSLLLSPPPSFNVVHVGK